MQKNIKKEGSGFAFRKSFIKRVGTLLLALVLCVGIFSPAAWAAPATPAGEATLQIVFGLDPSNNPNEVLNITYDFEAGATLKDMLDHAVAQGDIQAYELSSYGYIQSITSAGGTKLENATDYATYWSMFVDGSYYGGTDTVDTLALQDGEVYQFAWDSYPSAVVPNLSSYTYASAQDDGDDIGSGTIDTSVALYIFLGGTAMTENIYGVSSGATLEDLLDGVVANGSIEGYQLDPVTGYVNAFAYESYGYPTWVSSAADGTSNWALFIDGVYCNVSSGDASSLVLQDGATYQFVFETTPLALPPTWSALSAPTAGSGIVASSGYVPPAPQAAAPYSEQLFGSLFANIAASYQGTGDDWQAMNMAAIGQATSVDKNAIIANAVDAYNNPDTTNLQRSIIALTALGIDATNVVSGGSSYDLVEQMATTAISTNTVNGMIFALLAYASGPYAVPAGALMDIDDLITEVLAAQNADGGWSFAPGSSDADMTAMVLTALAPYSSESGVEAAIQEALTTLEGMQLPNGGFSSQYDSDPSMVNASTTAMAIIALSALGIDAQTWSVTSGGQTYSPIVALLSQANAAENGFLYGGTTNSMTTEQGFRALVAYQGFLNTGGAYNIYTQAKSGLAGLSLSNPSGNGNALPNTGDRGFVVVTASSLLALIGLSVLICALVLYRRRKSSRVL